MTCERPRKAEPRMGTEKQQNRTGAPAIEQADDIPLLTDIVLDPNRIDPETPAPSHDRERDRRSSVEVISRVQMQNLEHVVYQKLRKDLDGRIAEVVRDQFMPEIGPALEAAVEHIAQAVSARLRETVRACVEDALRSQLKALEGPSMARGAPGDPNERPV
jgi:hypothetical protein